MCTWQSITQPLRLSLAQPAVGAPQKPGGGCLVACVLFDSPPNKGHFDALNETGQAFPALQCLDDQRPLDPIHQIIKTLSSDGRRRLADGRGKQVRSDLWRLRSGEGDGTLDDVFELADIAGPAMASQDFQRLAGEPLGSLLLRRGVSNEEMLCDQG